MGMMESTLEKRRVERERHRRAAKEQAERRRDTRKATLTQVGLDASCRSTGFEVSGRDGRVGLILIWAHGNCGIICCMQRLSDMTKQRDEEEKVRVHNRHTSQRTVLVSPQLPHSPTCI
jgi:hypothetical protein